MQLDVSYMNISLTFFLNCDKQFLLMFNFIIALFVSKGAGFIRLYLYMYSYWVHDAGIAKYIKYVPSCGTHNVRNLNTNRTRMMEREELTFRMQIPSTHTLSFFNAKYICAFEHTKHHIHTNMHTINKKRVSKAKRTCYI